VEKGVLHIELVNRPVQGMSQGNDSMNSGRLDNRAESLVIVDAGLLGEPTEYPTSFVSVQRTISMKLVLENPFPGDHIRLGRTRDKIPSVVVQEGSMVFFHGLTPVRVSKGIPTGARDG